MKAESRLCSLMVLIVIDGTHAQNADRCFDESDTKSWKIDSGHGISYFYLSTRNAFMIYNEKIDYSLVLNSHYKTLAVFNVKSGFGGVINLDPVLGYYNGYVPINDLREFDMSQVKNNKCENLTAVYEYNAQFTSYVIEKNATNPNLGNITMMLEDCARTIDVTTFPSYAGNQKLIKLVQDHLMDLIISLHEIYTITNITVNDGLLSYSLFVSDYYNSPDARSEFLADFPSYLIKEIKGEIYEEMISEFYRLLSTEDDMDVIKREFGIMKEAVRQVCRIYESVPEAVKNYHTQN